MSTKTKPTISARLCRSDTRGCPSDGCGRPFCETCGEHQDQCPWPVALTVREVPPVQLDDLADHLWDDHAVPAEVSGAVGAEELDSWHSAMHRREEPGHQHAQVEPLGAAT